jgi:hypothetical protein
MPIDLNPEITEITTKLKKAEGYLECEKIVIHNIKKQVERGTSDENIILYLKKLLAWFEGKIEVNRHEADYTNYRYVAGFVDTLIKMPYWKTWMATIVA